MDFDARKMKRIDYHILWFLTGTDFNSTTIDDLSRFLLDFDVSDCNGEDNVCPWLFKVTKKL